MNTTMADGAEQRLDAQIAEALFGQPGMSKMDVANRVRELRGDGPALLVGGRSGGMVGSGDGLPPCPFCGHSDFDQWPCEYIDASGANVVRCARCHAAAPMKVWHALSAQPSPGGQGDELDLDRVLSLADVHAEESREDGVRLLDRGGLLAFARDVAAALAACSPVRIYGCCDQPEGELHTAECPNMRHLAARQPVGESMWVEIRREGDRTFPRVMKRDHAEAFLRTCNVGPLPTIHALYAAPPAQAVDLGAVREALRAAEGLATVCASVDGYSREEVAASGREMKRQFSDALAKIDSKAVGNG